MALRKILSVVWDYLLIAIGVFIYVVAWTSFMLPQGLVSGGLTGACAILSMATGVPVDVYYIGFNALLIVIGSLVLGKGFGFKTIYAILVATVLLRVLGSESFNFMKSLPGEFLYVEERVLVPIIGGLLEAIGISIIFQRGASTGGTDILALIINKFWPVSPGKVFLYSDLVIIATILLIPGHAFSDVIYGYIAMLVFSLGVDYVLMGRKSTVQVMVFSDRYAKIADHINRVMDRGVTALDAVGWYTKADKKILLVMVRKNQLSEVTKAVKEIDPRAFVSVVPANGVYGEGFDQIKTGLQRRKKTETH